MNGLGLYQVVTAALEPLAPLILKTRAAKGKEDAARMGERLGQASTERPDGPLVWLHGVSVGESVSLLPLIDRLRAERPGLNLLVTSGTVTSAQVLAKRLPPGVIHQYAPIDGRRAVGRFLDHWRPDAALFAESELWPNLILAAHSRGVKLALVSARITAHSAEGWAMRPGAARTLLSAFNLILPQDAASAERLTALGAKPGPQLNLKLVGAPLGFDNGEATRLQTAIGKRPVVVAASTHATEEGLIANATPARAFLIVAVRHPDRGAAVAAELAQAGRRVARRSAGEAITPDTDTYVADTLGEMGLWFALTDLVVMGGGFVEGVGGHNPLEPARQGCAIVSGSHSFNFADVYAAMASAGAVVVTGANGLKDDLAGLMAAPSRRKTLGASAKAFADSQADAFEAGWALIGGLLP